MKKHLLFLFTLLLVVSSLSAQTTGTFVVADNTTRFASCIDSTITIEDIFATTGIRDLNDPDDDISKYTIFRLSGSLITTDELTSFKISDYPAVFIKKNNTETNGRNGIQIWLSVLTPPTTLFDVDSLNYIVERGAKVNYLSNFFAHLNLWSTGLPEAPLQERIIFTDLATGISNPISQAPNWSNVGKGNYKLKISTRGCAAEPIADSIYVIVKENPCNNVEFKNIPSVCLDQVIDVTPYVYVNGTVANSTDLANMTFKNKSDLTNTTISTLNPTAIDIAAMYNRTEMLYPRVEITYQPNIDMNAGCHTYTYMFNTKVPAKFVSTDVVLTTDNYGKSSNYQLGGEFKAFNNVFHKNVLKKLYIDNYTGFSGSELSYFSDSELQNPVVGDDLSAGTYTGLITNPACETDRTTFSLNITNTDFKITWQSAPGMGKGYYTFNAPNTYPGATYTWFAWSGDIVSGAGTDQVIVYYSERAAQSVAVSCKITLPAVRTEGSNELNSSVYLTSDNQTGVFQEIEAVDDIVTTVDDDVLTSVASMVYPNPSEGTFAISGNGEYGLQVFDIIGQLIYSDNSYTAASPVNITNKGVYFIHLTQNSNRQILKVILK